MKRLAIAALALLTLTGCGPYALAFTPTGELPDYEDNVGIWRNDDATLTLADDRTFTIESLPSNALDNYSNDGEISGTVEDADGRPTGALSGYDLYDDEGEYVDTLYYYDGVLEAPVFLFATGVVDDGDWFRFAKD